MPSTPVVLSAFGGLDLRDPLDVGASGAVDLLNVEMQRRGKRLRVRDGYAKFNSSTLASSAYRTIHAASTGAHSGYIMAASANGTTLRLDSFDTTGTAVGAGTLATAYAPNTFVNFEGLVYFSMWDSTLGADTLRSWDPTAGGAPAAVVGKPRYVATTPISERLAQAVFGSAAASPTGADGSVDAVFFSDPQAASTYGADNFVLLDPGDGEQIVGMASFGSDLYVFKQTKVFVFYSETLLSDGSPEFNFRRILLPSYIPAGPGLDQARFVVATERGIFVSTVSGVYLLTGSGFTLVSAALLPLYTSDTSVSGRFFDLSTQGLPPALSWAGNRLFAAYTDLDLSAKRQLVLDPETGLWSRWNINSLIFSNFGGGSAASFPQGAGRERVWFPLGTDIYATSPASTTDNGTAVAWSWKSGKYPLDPSGRVAITQESAVFGTGTVTLTLSTDSFADQSGAVTLGTAPTPAEGWLQKDQEGRYWQHTLSGSGQATVESLMHQVGFLKPAGIE